MEQSEGLNLERFVHLARRRIWVLVLCVVVVAGSMYGLAVLSEDVYRASSDVLLVSDDPLNDDVSLETELRVAESPVVQQAAFESLGSDAELVSGTDVSAIDETSVIKMTAESSTPEVARDAANAIAAAYVEERRRDATDELASRIEELDKQIQETETELADLDAVLASLAGSNDPAASSRVSSDRQVVADRLQSLQAQRDDLLLEQAVADGGVKVLADADLPDSPVSPKPLRQLVLGALLGLAVGVAAVFVVDRIDKKVRSVDDLRALGVEAQVIREIPLPTRGSPSEQLLAASGGTLAPTQGYRDLAQGLEALALDAPLHSLLVSGPVGAEGSSTVAANLAVSLAASGKIVVAAAADLRQPRLQEFFELDRSPGITTILTGSKPTFDTLRRVDVAPEVSVHVLTSGPAAPRPSELLVSDEMEKLLRELGNFSDWLVVEAPPVLQRSDVLTLARSTDGVVLVFSAGVTRKAEVERSLEIFSLAGVEIVSVVLARRGRTGFPGLGAFRLGTRAKSAGTSGARGGGRSRRSEVPTRRTRRGSAVPAGGS